MAILANSSAVSRKPIPNLRWWIGGLLFASTVINYIDRQTLSVLGPYLKIQYQWNNQQFAAIVIAFRVAYSIGQTSRRLFHRPYWNSQRSDDNCHLVFDRRNVNVACHWTAQLCVLSFSARRGESANWPAATKAVSEWFPKKERGWAVALFDSGSSIGGAIAPLLVIGLYKYFGGWRPAFVITGTLGFLWLGLWRVLYYPPESHPRISDAEREMILKDRIDLEEANPNQQQSRWRDLIKLPQTWAVIAARTMTDPVWFFITDWFAIYLVTKGVNPEQGLLAFWIPFVAADLGNFFGWWSVELADKSRLAGNQGAKGCRCVWRPGHDSFDPDNFHVKPRRARGLVCSFNFRLRLIFHDGSGVALRSFQKPIRGNCQWNEWHRRRFGNDHIDLPDRLCFRSLFIRTNPDWLRV